MYGDVHRNAQQSEISVGDSVLFRKDKGDKLSTTFENQPYAVVDKRGNQVTIQSPQGVQYKRNITHVKKFSGGNEVPLDLDVDTSQERVTIPDVIDSDGVEVASEPQVAVRPSRERKMPSKFQDYVVK